MRDPLAPVRGISTWRQALVLGVVVGIGIAVLILAFGYQPVETVAGAGIAAAGMWGVARYARAHDMAGEPPRAVLRWLVDLRWPTRRDSLAAVVVVAATLSLTVLIGTAANLFTDGQGASHGGAAAATGGVPWWVFGIFAVFAIVVGPVLEELVFRNGLQKISAAWIGTWPAILATSALFAAFHIPSYGGLGQSALGLGIPLGAVFVDSAVYGYAYYRTGNVAVPMIAHSAHNAIAITSILV